MIALVPIGWAIEALVASGVLMIAVLLVRKPVRSAFGPDIAYALWALPALRLVLPPLPQSWREIAVAPAIRASETITVYVIEPLAGNAATPAVQYPLLGPIAVTLWVAGAVAFIGWHMLAHRRFCRRLLVQQVRAIEVEGGVQLIETDAASGPLAFGIWRKYVAFPRDFVERYDQDERDLALAHELGHHARGDLVANWAALTILALHWFNPVAWRAFKAFRADQEIANDARVLAGRDPIDRHAYACAIIKAAHGGAVSAACHLHTIDDLKGRLRMLSTTRISRARLVSGAAAIALLTVGGLGLTASGTQAAERFRSGVSDTIGVDLAAIDLSRPRVPAVPPAPIGRPAPAVPAAPAIAVTTPAPVLPVQASAPPVVSTTPMPPRPPVPPEAYTEDHSAVTTSEGKRVKRVIIRGNDGSETVTDMPEIPEVSSMNCPPDGNEHRTVINENNGHKRKIIICTNRIKAAVERSAMLAANSKDIERNAYRSALASLKSARAGLRGMSDAQRREAIPAIEESIAELEADLAKLD